MKGFAYASTPWSSFITSYAPFSSKQKTIKYFPRKNDQLESFVAGSLVASFAWL
jgi:hypothetical protein